MGMLAMDTALRTDRNRRNKQKKKYHIFNNPGLRIWFTVKTKHLVYFVSIRFEHWVNNPGSGPTIWRSYTVWLDILHSPVQSSFYKPVIKAKYKYCHLVSVITLYNLKSKHESSSFMCFSPIPSTSVDKSSYPTFILQFCGRVNLNVLKIYKVRPKPLMT